MFRDALKRNYNLGHFWVEINIEDLSSFDEVLAEKLYKKPTEHLPILEEAAKEVKFFYELICCFGLLLSLIFIPTNILKRKDLFALTVTRYLTYFDETLYYEDTLKP